MDKHYIDMRNFPNMPVVGEAPKAALIFGVTGQDGSYLSELLLEKGYKVVGVARRSSVDTSERLGAVKNNERFVLVEGDITDAHCVSQLITKYQPRECYNLAAQSHVGTSFDQPTHTLDVDLMGVLNILEAIRYGSPDTRFYQASTSEMFGSNYTEVQEKDEVDAKLTEDNVLSYMDNVGILGLICSVEKNTDGDLVLPLAKTVTKRFQNESTTFSPNSPYAVAKLAAHHMVDLYRKSYGLHVSSGILMNHESERRGEQFVTRKITKWIGEYQAWIYRLDEHHSYYNHFDGDDIVRTMDTSEMRWRFPKLRLGNLDAKRDWGHAKDHTRAMHLMLQQDEPDDYIIATGESYSVREFLDEAFSNIGIEDWEPYIVIDPEFYRPCEVEFLLGNATKAKEKLGWEPEVSFKELVKRMVEHDIEKAQKA